MANDGTTRAPGAWRIRWGLVALAAAVVVGCGPTASGPKTELKKFKAVESPGGEKTPGESATAVSASGAPAADQAARPTDGAAGLIPPPPPASITTPPTVGSAAVESTSKEAGRVELKVGTLAEFQAFLESLRGRPVVVDAWATWCAPCREKFPAFVDLARAHGAKYHFVSLSLDLEEKEADAQAFLESVGATFANFLVTDEASRVQESFEFSGVPSYLMFDAEGKVTFRAEKFEELKAKVGP